MDIEARVASLQLDLREVKEDMASALKAYCAFEEALDELSNDGNMYADRALDVMYERFRKDQYESEQDVKDIEKEIDELLNPPEPYVADAVVTTGEWNETGELVKAVVYNCPNCNSRNAVAIHGEEFPDEVTCRRCGIEVELQY